MKSSESGVSLFMLSVQILRVDLHLNFWLKNLGCLIRWIDLYAGIYSGNNCNAKPAMSAIQTSDIMINMRLEDVNHILKT